MKKLALVPVLLLPLLMGVSAGKSGSGTGSTGVLNPDVVQITGSLLYLDATGRISIVPGTVVDPSTGAMEGSQWSTPEDTTLDTNAMGTATNNIGGSTINNCNTTNGTTNDNVFRITDLAEAGTSGTPGNEVMEECIGKSLAMDDFKYDGGWVGANTGGAVPAINGFNKNITGSSTAPSITSAVHRPIFGIDLRKDPATGNFTPLYVDTIRLTIDAATGWSNGECLAFQLRTCDSDGGIASATNDCNLIGTKVQVAFDNVAGGADCAAADKDCGGVFPCIYEWSPKTFLTVQGSLVTTTAAPGNGQIDIWTFGYDETDANNTADAISSFTAGVTIWGKN